MKEAYVTGGGGFIGKHLTERLDDFTAIPHEDILSYKLEPYKRFFFLSTYGNMSTHTDVDEVVRANVTDLVSVLRQTDFEDGLQSFVYVSSSSVARKVHTMYSRTKLASEEILLGYMETFNAPIAIVRPFSVTGVGEQSDHLIPKLIQSCIEGTKMPFVPEPVHDFIDVDDVVNGILTLSSKHAKGVFELGTGISHTNQQVLEMVESATERKANVQVVKNLRSYDSDFWVSTNMKARTFGWSPEKTLEQSIQEMVSAYKHK